MKIHRGIWRLRKKPATGSLAAETKGFTLTQNETEHYVTGVDRVRYVTQVNCYGFAESDKDFQSIAYVLVKLPTTVDATTGTIVVKNLLDNDSTFKAKLIEELNANRSDGKRDTNTALVLDVASVGDDLKTICYTCDIVPTVVNGTADPRAETITANETVFTNKNRAQFVFDVRADLVKAGTTNSNLMVFAAIKYADNEIGQNEYTNLFYSDATNHYAYIVSDNYVVYDNNTHTTTGGAG